MGGQIGRITEQTLIPVGLLGAIVGMVFWVSGIYYTGIANAKEIQKLTEQQTTYNAFVISIDKRLAIIESNTRVRK